MFSSSYHSFFSWHVRSDTQLYVRLAALFFGRKTDGSRVEGHDASAISIVDQMGVQVGVVAKSLERIGCGRAGVPGAWQSWLQNWVLLLVEGAARKIADSWLALGRRGNTTRKHGHVDRLIRTMIRTILVSLVINLTRSNKR